MANAAPIRAKEYVSVAINARSRRSRSVSVGMLSNKARHSAASSTGVIPVLSTCFGPRTADAGFMGMIWPTTIQSKSMQMAASCRFTEGADTSRLSPST